MPILVHGQVNGAEAAAPNLLLDNVLVYSVHGGAVIVAAAIVGTGIEGFLDSTAARRRSAVVSNGALISRDRHVLDHLWTASFRGGRKVDVNSVAWKDTGSFDLGRRGRSCARRVLNRRRCSHDVACAEAALDEGVGNDRGYIYMRGGMLRGGAGQLDEMREESALQWGGEDHSTFNGGRSGGEFN